MVSCEKNHKFHASPVQVNLGEHCELWEPWGNLANLGEPWRTLWAYFPWIQMFFHSYVYKMAFYTEIGRVLHKPQYCDIWGQNVMLLRMWDLDNTKKICATKHVIKRDNSSQQPHIITCNSWGMLKRVIVWRFAAARLWVKQICHAVFHVHSMSMWNVFLWKIPHSCFCCSTSGLALVPWTRFFAASWGSFRWFAV